MLSYKLCTSLWHYTTKSEREMKARLDQNIYYVAVWLGKENDNLLLLRVCGNYQAIVFVPHVHTYIHAHVHITCTHTCTHAHILWTQNQGRFWG